MRQIELYDTDPKIVFARTHLTSLGNFNGSTCVSVWTGTDEQFKAYELAVDAYYRQFPPRWDLWLR